MLTWEQRHWSAALHHCGLLHEHALEGFVGFPSPGSIPRPSRKELEEVATQRRLDLSHITAACCFQLFYSVEASAVQRFTDHTLWWKVNLHAFLFCLYLAVLSLTGIHRDVTHLLFICKTLLFNTKTCWQRLGHLPTTVLPSRPQTDLVVDEHFSLRSPTTSRPPTTTGNILAAMEENHSSSCSTSRQPGPCP